MNQEPRWWCSVFTYLYSSPALALMLQLPVQVIDLVEGPEEVEVLTFPAGSVLRLGRIRHSAFYTCRVANGNRLTDTQVAVDPNFRSRHSRKIVLLHKEGFL